MGNGEKTNALRDARSTRKEHTTDDHETFSYAEFDVPLYRKPQGHPEYMKVLDERKALHIEKSSGYGTGDDPFANFTAVANAKNQPRFVYPVDRVQEKITRIYSLISQGRFWDLEEEFKDCASLFDCATAMLRVDTTKKSLELVRPCRHIYEVEGCNGCSAS